MNEEETPLGKMARDRMRSGYRLLEAAEMLDVLLNSLGLHDHAMHHGRPLVELTVQVKNVDAEMPDIPSLSFTVSTGVDYTLEGALVTLHKALASKAKALLTSGEEMLLSARMLKEPKP